MLDKEFLKKLKQTDVSIDSAKTKARMTAIWKTCGKAGRKEMADMIDGAVSTFHAAALKGRVSVKLAIPMAVVGDVDPAYLTGATDDPSICTDEKISAFLAANGYGVPKTPSRRGRPKAEKAKAAPAKAKTPRKRKTKAEDIAEAGAPTEEIDDAPEYFPELSDVEDIPVITWAGEPDDGLEDTVYIDPELAELLEMADEKIAGFDPDKFAALDDLSFSDLEILIRSLEIKMSASDSARTLMRLVRLLLV